MTTIRQALEAEREQELSAIKPGVLFPASLLTEIGEAHPLAAAILESFTRNSLLTVGEFKGLLSITPSDGTDGPVEVYAFEAQVTPSPAAERFTVSVWLADHPEIERITGTIRLQEGESEVRIHGLRGDTEVFSATR